MVSRKTSPEMMARLDWMHDFYLPKRKWHSAWLQMLVMPFSTRTFGCGKNRVSMAKRHLFAWNAICLFASQIHWIPNTLFCVHNDTLCDRWNTREHSLTHTHNSEYVRTICSYACILCGGATNRANWLTMLSIMWRPRLIMSKRVILSLCKLKSINRKLERYLLLHICITRTQFLFFPCTKHK